MFSEGTVFSGYFDNNLFHGKGKLTSKSCTIEGNFERGEVIG
jgi:hypothetical protein